MKKQQYKGAFSLIELMVVIVIIGILSAIAVPAYNSYVIKAKVTELLTMAESIQPRMVTLYNAGDPVLASASSTTQQIAASLGLSGAFITLASPSPYVHQVIFYNAATAWAIANCNIHGFGTSIGAVFVIAKTGGGYGTNNALGVPTTGSYLNLLKLGCVKNDVITWMCGYGSGTLANNIQYLPTNCQHPL